MVLDNLTKLDIMGMILFAVGAAFFVVGFSVPRWIVRTIIDRHIGLWQACTLSYCSGTISSSFKDLGLNGPPDWFRGAQILACVALIAVIADLVMRGFYICKQPGRFLLASAVLDGIAAVLAFSTAMAFGSNIGGYIGFELNWSFAFDILGGICFAGAEACFLVGYSRNR